MLNTATISTFILTLEATSSDKFIRRQGKTTVYQRGVLVRCWDVVLRSLTALTEAPLTSGYRSRVLLLHLPRWTVPFRTVEKISRRVDSSGTLRQGQDLKLRETDSVGNSQHSKAPVSLNTKTQDVRRGCADGANIHRQLSDQWVLIRCICKQILLIPSGNYHWISINIFLLLDRMTTLMLKVHYNHQTFLISTLF